MPVFVKACLLATSNLSAHPRNRCCKCADPLYPFPVTLCPFLPSAKESGYVQPAHARMPHELGHTVDYNDRRLALFRAIERGNEFARIFTVHYVNGENQLSQLQFVVNDSPLVIHERRAKVVRA